MAYADICRLRTWWGGCRQRRQRRWPSPRWCGLSQALSLLWCCTHLWGSHSPWLPGSLGSAAPLWIFLSGGSCASTKLCWQSIWYPWVHVSWLWLDQFFEAFPDLSQRCLWLRAPFDLLFLLLLSCCWSFTGAGLCLCWSLPVRLGGVTPPPKRSAWPLFTSFFFDAFPKLCKLISLQDVWWLWRHPDKPLGMSGKSDQT